MKENNSKTKNRFSNHDIVSESFECKQIKKIAGLLIMVITTKSFACKQSLHRPHPATAKPYFNHIESICSFCNRRIGKESFSLAIGLA